MEQSAVTKSSKSLLHTGMRHHTRIELFSSTGMRPATKVPGAAPPECGPGSRSRDLLGTRSLSLMLLNRRTFLRAGGACALSFLAGHRSYAVGEEGHLLDPQRIIHHRLPPLSSVKVIGTRVTYTVQGPPHAPLLLYFHGWGDDYRVVLPLEYPLSEAGYRLLVFHRPGYAGTALSGRDGGRRRNWRTAAGQAELAAGLLDYLHSGRTWHVSVIGTSGGAPAALAFAAAYAQHTRALVLQAGATQPWSDARYVPAVFRDAYATAFQKFGWAGDAAAMAVFGLMVKFRENFFQDEDKIRALAGSRLEQVRQDPAFTSIVATILREHSGNARGEVNDARSIFFSRSAYCRWDEVRVPTLVVHDPEDMFVPFVHAEEAAKLLPRGELRPFHLGGHILWTGREARAMHRTRIEFMRAAH
jgi:pimeloyl-ACP methyl ester carboxylesterase